MSSININKILLVFVALATFSSCNLFEKSHPLNECEHELFKQGHFLELPVSFIPYKQEYKIGDTVEVNITFADSIYDQGTQKKFKIEKMPFRPISSLYRINIDEDSWDSGFRVNELIMDTLKYDLSYQFHSIISDNIRANHIYNPDADLYEYSYQIVFQEPGVYLFRTIDYQTTNVGKDDQIDSEHDNLVNSIDFEGKCNIGLHFWYTLQHDGHYYEYQDELIYLDQTILNNNYSSYDDGLGLGSGVTKIETTAFFCFEVTE